MGFCCFWATLTCIYPQRWETRFTSLGLAMASIAFDFIDNLNIYCLVSCATTKNIISTHKSKFPTLLGWQYVFLITRKCLVKLAYSFSYNQYCGYTTSKLISIIPWNFPSSFLTRQLTALAIRRNPHIHIPKSLTRFVTKNAYVTIIAQVERDCVGSIFHLNPFYFCNLYCIFIFQNPMHVHCDYEQWKCNTSCKNKMG